MLDKDFNTELLIARRRKRWKAKEEELRAESRNGKCADQEDSAGLSLQVGWFGRWLKCLDAWILAWMLGCLDAWMLAWLNGWVVLGCLDAWMLGCLDAWMLACLNGWVVGCLDAWMLGCLDTWIL